MPETRANNLIQLRETFRSCGPTLQAFTAYLVALASLVLLGLLFVHANCAGLPLLQTGAYQHSSSMDQSVVSACSDQEALQLGDCCKGRGVEVENVR